MPIYSHYHHHKHKSSLNNISININNMNIPMTIAGRTYSKLVRSVLYVGIVSQNMVVKDVH